MIHQNSVFAYHDCNKETRRKEVLAVYREYGTPFTDRKIKEKLGLTDMNEVRPRVSELIVSGDLIECAEKTKDHRTHKTVRLVKFAYKKEYQQEMFRSA